jgi:hypothetical protein
MTVSRLDSVLLLDGVATGIANGNGPTIDIPVNSICSIYVSGALGGGNVQVQVSPDHGVTWFPLGSAIAAAGGAPSYNQVVATAIRAVVAGATSPAIKCWAALVEY